MKSSSVICDIIKEMKRERKNSLQRVQYIYDSIHFSYPKYNFSNKDKENNNRPKKKYIPFEKSIQINPYKK